MTNPRSIDTGDEFWAEARETIDIIVAEEEPVETGLVDQWGKPIRRYPKRNPVGFMR